MSDSNKTRYEVQKIVGDAVKEALVNYIGATHGFGVMEFAQASFQNADRIVLINPIRAKRVGWQGVKYGTTDDVYRRTDEWVEEQSWQIHVILKKSQSPTISELQADDVAAMLITYLNGNGAYTFRNAGCAPLRIADDSIVVYNDDSELYQKRAVFTLQLQVPKALSMVQDDVTMDEYTFEGVYPV